MQKINGGCEDLIAPTDYSHGFAFITLFGDQSRFLDAQVWRKNSIHGLDETEMEVNVGYYNKDNGAYPNCTGRFVYWKNPYTAWKSYSCPKEEFTLGTSDWSEFTVNTTSTFNTVGVEIKNEDDDEGTT